MAKKVYELTIEPLTGVHIGTGEELTLLDYKVMQMKAGNDMYVKFSSDRMLEQLIKEEKDLSAFYAAGNANNIKAIKKFFHKNISKESIEYPCAITKSFKRKYDENNNKDPVENAALVHQMYRPAGKKTPVIPGSALKGSIRTAILNDILDQLYKKNRNQYDRYLEELKHERNKKCYDTILQQNLLDFKDAKNDPFRTIHIEDVSFDAKNTQLVGLVKNISAKFITEDAIELEDDEKFQNQAEIIRGSLIGGAAITRTHITIDEDLQHTKIDRQGKKPFSIKKRLSMKDIAESCNYFFMREFDDEYDYFFAYTIEGTKYITELKKQLEQTRKTPHAFIVRVGRWSQVEFLTVENNFRHIKTPTRGGKPQGYGNTRTVFDYDGEYIPLGWCKCTYKEIPQ